jgi:murein DD-endopeptidase MepM/ murein hydrolase activator NlpD
MKRIALMSILLASSCHPAIEDRTLDLSCKPEVPNPPAIAPVASWIRGAWPVEPKGVFTKHHWQDQGVLPPTALTLAELKLGAGDYVGLQAFGRWYWGSQTGPGAPTSDSLGAIFADNQGHFLAPAKSGQEEAFRTPPLWHSGEPTDITQDFSVPTDRETIVRIPAGATKILFEVNDSAFGDNSVAGEFGVRVFEPNHRSAEPAGLKGQADDDEFAGAPDPRMIRSLLAEPVPEATSFSFSPFADQQSPDAGSQWRGNYINSGWAPSRSVYAGKRSTERHWGWDIFSPKGSALVAPAWPSRMTIKNLPPTVDDHGNPRSNFGLTAIFTFKYKRKIYMLFYGHLDSIKGEEGVINDPEIVAYSGCSGLTPSDLVGCGSRYETGSARGMRNDHVHVGLWYPVNKETKTCDPRALLNWAIR